MAVICRVSGRLVPSLPWSPSSLLAGSASPGRLRSARLSRLAFAMSSEPAKVETELGGLAATSGARKDRRRVLTRQQAREVYDENGKKDRVKDSESIYGGPATEALLSNASFDTASLVDQSEVMHSLASQRLQEFKSRVVLRHVPDGDPSTCAEGIASDGAVDVFVSTYVLDLLSEEDCEAVLKLAGRLVRPGGQLCLSGLTFGNRVGVLPSLTTMIWEAVHSMWPTLVGGCRAQNLEDYLGPLWEVQSSTLVSGGYLSSEVLICKKREDE